MSASAQAVVCSLIFADMDRIVISDYLELVSAAKATTNHFSSLDPAYVPLNPPLVYSAESL